MPLHRGPTRCVKLLSKVFIFLSLTYIFFLASQVSNSRSHGNPDDVFVSMVLPATNEDFLCFARHVSGKIKLLSALPGEVIFIVSGVQDPTELPSIKLSGLVKTQVLTVPQTQNQAKNRNLGAALARGEYVFFFDIDDVLHLDAFRMIYQTIQKFDNSEAFIYSHGSLKTIKHRKHIPLKPFCYSSRQTCEIQEPYTSQELFHALFEHWTINDDDLSVRMHWCCLQTPHQNLAPGWLLVKRLAFLKHGVFDDSIETGEDGNQIARMIAQGMQVMYVDIQLGYYNHDHKHPECAHQAAYHIPDSRSSF